MEAIIDFLLTLNPLVSTIFIVLGGSVVVGGAIDAAVDDKIDHGFMKKILAIPVLGPFLKALRRFSPFNVKNK